MRHLTLLHVPNMGVDVIFIVEAIFVFGLSSLREVGRSKHFFFFGGGGIFFFLVFLGRKFFWKEFCAPKGFMKIS